MWGHGMWLFFPMIIMGKLIWLVFLALLIAGIVRLFAARRRPIGPWGPVPFPPVGPQPTQQGSALEILRQRYARGEIDATTFDQMRERLEATYAPRQQ
jgi:putative membrane protein